MMRVGETVFHQCRVLQLAIQYQMISLENIFVQIKLHALRIVFILGICVCVYITIKEKETMNLEENKLGYIEKFGCLKRREQWYKYHPKKFLLNIFKEYRITTKTG